MTAASIVTYSVASGAETELAQNVATHIVPAARETDGYLGFLLLDLGDARRMAILVYDTIEHVRAAQAALTPFGERHTYHLMSSPAIGAGGVALITDGIFQSAAS